MGGGQTVSRSPHRRLINLRMLTRSSDPLAASRCGGLGPGKGGSAEGQTQLHPKAGVLFVCLFNPGRPARQPGSSGYRGWQKEPKDPAALVFSSAAECEEGRGICAREEGKGGCFETLEASHVSPACASRRSVGGRLSGEGTTAVPVRLWHMHASAGHPGMPPAVVGPIRLTCLACRRGATGPQSNQAAREGEPSTFPKHDLPASLSLPEPHLKSTPLHPPNSPAHLLTQPSTPLNLHPTSA